MGNSVDGCTDEPPPYSLGSVPVELVSVLVLATVLRVYRLTDESLWIDENFMVQVATEYTLAELVFELPLFEPHPPLYNVVMWGWVAIGDATTLWMRSSSVAFSVATIPVLYLLAWRLFDRQTAGVAILLFAVSPFQIWHAQDARMYALLVLATVTGWYLLVRLREAVTSITALAYLLSGIVLGYTHVYGLFVLLAHVLVVAWWLRKAPEQTALTVPQSIGLFGGIGALVSPWLAVLATRVFVPDPAFEDPADWLVPPGALELIETVRIHMFGFTRVRAPYELLPETPAILALTVALPIALVIAAWFLEDLREHEHSLGIVAVWLLVPVFVPFVLSVLVQPMYELRYTIVAAPAAILLVALGIQTVRSAPARVVLVVLVLLTVAYPLPAYYGEAQKDQWEDAATVVGSEATDDDAILIAPGWTQSAFAYYYGDRPGKQIPIFAGTPQWQYDEAVTDGNRTFLIMSYLDDRDAVLERTESAVDRPPDAHYEFVRVEIYVWR